jgi:hypothetical protein
MKRNIFVFFVLTASLILGGAAQAVSTGPYIPCSVDENSVNFEDFLNPDCGFQPLDDGGVHPSLNPYLDEDVDPATVAGKPIRPTRSDDENYGGADGYRISNYESGWNEFEIAGNTQYDNLGLGIEGIESYYAQEANQENNPEFKEASEDGSSLGLGIRDMAQETDSDDSIREYDVSKDLFIPPGVYSVFDVPDDTGDGTGVDGSCSDGFCTYTVNGYPGGIIAGRVIKFEVVQYSSRRVTIISVDGVELDRR